MVDPWRGNDEYGWLTRPGGRSAQAGPKAPFAAIADVSCVAGAVYLSTRAAIGAPRRQVPSSSRAVGMRWHPVA
jgi:hypothetical protein